MKLEGNKYLVDAILAGQQTLTSPLFPGWEITLDELFRFPSRPPAAQPKSSP